MEITIIGFVELALGIAILLFGGMRSTLALLLGSLLLGGSAALKLPSLGGSSIPPAQLALLFVYLRLLMPGGGYLWTIAESVRNNIWLVFFALFAIASSYIAPRIFAGTMDVFPMSYGDARNLFDTVPLEPTSQNVTAALYIVGSALAAIATYSICRFGQGYQTLVSAGIVMAWIHVTLGWAAIPARGMPADAIFEFFRNGQYAQMDNALGSFVRIRGTFPEAAAYTKLAFGLFVLNAELWYRSIRSRATGMAACALAATMFFSTSSTAYVGLSVYFVAWWLRLMLFPFDGAGRKLKAMLNLCGTLVVLAAVMLAVVPGLAQQTYDMLVHMTVAKSSSSSGQQRLFWALQGWEAFKHSYGLGVGPGSFRSSSSATAMLGSVGIIGTAAFLAYVYSFFQPWRRSSYMETDDLTHDLGGAFASAAVLSLITSIVSSPHVDPGMHFAIFAGAALAMRPRTLASYSDEAASSAPVMTRPSSGIEKLA